MIDQRLREHVSTQVHAVEGTHGNLASVVRRGERRRKGIHVFQAVAALLLMVGLVAVSGQLARGPIADQVPEADLRLTINPGQGPSTLADELAERSGPRAVQGTAEHIGWVETPQGRFDLVTYVEADDPSRPSDRPTCAGGIFVGAVSDDPRFSAGLCDPSGEIPPRLIGSYGRQDDFFYILEPTPPNTQQAILTTGEGNTIHIATISGYVFATWPASWGPPTVLTALNPEGGQTGSFNYTE